MDRYKDAKGQKHIKWGFLIFDAIVINGEVRVVSRLLFLPAFFFPACDFSWQASFLSHQTVLTDQPSSSLFLENAPEEVRRALESGRTRSDPATQRDHGTTQLCFSRGAVYRGKDPLTGGGYSIAGVEKGAF